MLATVCLGKFCFLRGTHRADHARPEMAGPLAHNQADAPGGGLYQNGFASAD
jgi:hypothetical protein